MNKIAKIFNSRKSTLQLSVNAIVILIIAIVVLALSLGFIRTMFSGITTKSSALIEKEPEPPIPSSSDVITLSRGKLMTTPKKAEVIKINVYNPAAVDWDSIKPTIRCSMPIADDFKTNPKAIKRGEYETFTALFTIKSDAVSSNICIIEVNDYSKDFIISVKGGKAEVSETTTSQEYCKNAKDNGLCDGLDVVFGEGYREGCCKDYGLCC